MGRAGQGQGAGMEGSWKTRRRSRCLLLNSFLFSSKASNSWSPPARGFRASGPWGTSVTTPSTLPQPTRPPGMPCPAGPGEGQAPTPAGWSMDPG